MYHNVYVCIYIYIYTHMFICTHNSDNTYLAMYDMFASAVQPTCNTIYIHEVFTNPHAHPRSLHNKQTMQANSGQRKAADD